MAKVSPQEQAIRDRRAAQKRGDVRRLPGVGDQVIDATFRVESKPVPALVAPTPAPTGVAAIEAEVETIIRDLTAGAKLIDSGRVRLLRLKESGDWSRLGFTTWGSFCAERLGITARSAERACQAARIALEIDSEDVSECISEHPRDATNCRIPQESVDATRRGPDDRRGETTHANPAPRPSGGSMPSNQLRELEGLSSREVGKVIARADEMAKGRGGKRSAADLGSARRELHPGPASEPETSDVTSAAIEAMAPTGRVCRRCGEPID